MARKRIAQQLTSHLTPQTQTINRTVQTLLILVPVEIEPVAPAPVVQGLVVLVLAAQGLLEMMQGHQALERLPVVVVYQNLKQGKLAINR